ncbi:AGAP009351-PA, partial [Anopheles gambiae str. PEST]
TRCTPDFDTTQRTQSHLTIARERKRYSEVHIFPANPSVSVSCVCECLLVLYRAFHNGNRPPSDGGAVVLCVSVCFLCAKHERHTHTAGHKVEWICVWCIGFVEAKCVEEEEEASSFLLLLVALIFALRPPAVPFFSFLSCFPAKEGNAAASSGPDFHRETSDENMSTYSNNSNHSKCNRCFVSKE